MLLSGCANHLHVWDAGEDKLKGLPVTAPDGSTVYLNIRSAPFLAKPA